MADATLPRSDFYVYVMFRPDGSPCYVGKGRGGRVHNHSARNDWLKKIIKKYGILPVVKIRQGMTESEAFLVEIAFIAAIGRAPIGPLANLTDGGEGASGFVRSLETRAKLRLANLGKKHSATTRAKIAEKSKNPSQEVREKIRASLLGRPRHPDAVAKTIAGNKGRRRSAEFCERMRLLALGRKPTPEAREKMSAAKRGKPLPDTFVVLGRAAVLGRPRSQETRDKIRAAQIGKHIPPETRAKMSVSQKLRVAEKGSWWTGRQHSPSSKEKMRASALARYARAQQSDP